MNEQEGHMTAKVLDVDEMQAIKDAEEKAKKPAENKAKQGVENKGA